MNQKAKQPEGGLLQSHAWKRVLCADHKEVIEIVSGDKKFFGVVQKLPIVGTYVYVPRVRGIDETFIDAATQLQCGWVRCDLSTQSDVDALNNGCKKSQKAPHEMQPKTHLIVDITHTEEDLLAQMKSKTRYNIRLAEKKGVHVFATKKQQYIDAFIALVADTAQRKGVVFHEREHYENIITQLPKDAIDLYVAKYNGKVVAANLVSFYKGTATYLHGATADVHRNVMAPFLLQWRAMCDAKEKGCVWYDFGGVFPDADDPGKKGITRFKNGFAPHEPVYMTQGSYDIVLSRWRYLLYRIIQKMRKSLI